MALHEDSLEALERQVSRQCATHYLQLRLQRGAFVVRCAVCLNRGWQRESALQKAEERVAVAEQSCSILDTKLKELSAFKLLEMVSSLPAWG